MNDSDNAKKDGCSRGSLENKPPKEGRSNNQPKQDSVNSNKTQNSEAPTQASRGAHQDDNIDNMHREGTQVEKLPSKKPSDHGANNFVGAPILQENSNSSNRGSDTTKRKPPGKKNSGATGKARQSHSKPAWDDYESRYKPPQYASMGALPARPPSSRKRRTPATWPGDSDIDSESYQDTGNMPFNTMDTRSERSTSAGPQQKSTTFDQPVQNTSDAYLHRSAQETSSATGSSESQRSSRRRKQPNPSKYVGSQGNNGEDSQDEDSCTAIWRSKC